MSHWLFRHHGLTFSLLAAFVVFACADATRSATCRSEAAVPNGSQPGTPPGGLRVPNREINATPPQPRGGFDPRRRWAVIVDAHQHSLAGGAQHESDRVRRHLANALLQCGWLPEQVTSLSSQFSHQRPSSHPPRTDDENAIVSRIRAALDRAAKDDTAILVFLGARYRDISGHWYLDCGTTTSRNVAKSALKMADLSRLLRENSDLNRVLIFAGNAYRHPPESDNEAELAPGDVSEIPEEDDWLHAFDNVPRLSVLSTHSGGQSSTPLLDRSDDLLLHFLIRGLTGEADINGDRLVDVDEWLSHTATAVATYAWRQSQRLQTPVWFHTHNMDSSACLSLSNSPTPASTPASTPANTPTRIAGSLLTPPAPPSTQVGNNLAPRPSITAAPPVTPRSAERTATDVSRDPVDSAQVGSHGLPAWWTWRRWGLLGACLALVSAATALVRRQQRTAYGARPRDAATTEARQIVRNCFRAITDARKRGLEDSPAARHLSDQLRCLHLLLERVETVLENLPAGSSGQLAAAATVLDSLTRLSQRITTPSSTIEQLSLTASECERCLLDLEAKIR